MNVGFWLVFIYDGFILRKRCLHVYEALVAAAAKVQALVFQGFNEWAVYKNVYVLQQLLLLRVFEYFLEYVTCVTPYVFCAVCFYCCCKFGESLGLIHWVASAECYVGKGVGEDYFKNLVGGYSFPV